MTSWGELVLDFVGVWDTAAVSRQDLDLGLTILAS